VNAAAVGVGALRFSYEGGPRILDGIELQVQPGEIFGIAGADGAGKSTLLRILIGQLPGASGDIEVLGRPPGDAAMREAIAYMPQSFGQYADLSVLENLQFFAALHGRTGDEARTLIADLLARAGLRGFEGRRAGQLSGGMMQKLALACALVSRPRAMFLDEPTTGVDPLSRRAFWQLLEGVRGEGVAIVYATANMDEAERCDRVATLEGGRLVRQGRPQDLVLAAGASLYVLAGATARDSVPALLQRPEIDFAFPVGRHVKVWLKPGADDVGWRAALARDTPALQAQPASPGLHDLVLRELALAQRAQRHA
jgi:ABC-2 type transport system ATP-binding protein